MGDLFLLSEDQMARISPFFPLSHGVPRVDDRRVLSGIFYVIRNGLQWKDAPAGYGPHKTQSLHPLEPDGGVRPHLRGARRRRTKA
jgi:transposase